MVVRILFLSTWFPDPLDNGSKIRVYYLLRALADKHQVHLLCFRFGTALFNIGSDLESICDSVEAVDIDPFVHNQKHAIQRFLSSQPVVNRPVPQMTHLVEQKLARIDFDVIIASGELMATYALQGQETAVKVLEEHNSFSRLMYDRFSRSDYFLLKSKNWVSYQKVKRYERKLFSRFDLITMVSEQDKDFSERHVNRTGVKIEVVPNGVDSRLNHPGIARLVPGRLLYSGALTYSANFDAMVFFLQDIYPLIKRKVPSVSLVITGSIDGVEIEQLALDESVRLTGYVQDIRLEITSAMALVVPLRIGGGSRLKILEAMALGTPVIATTKGAESIDITNGKDMLIADDPTVFAELTIRLLQEEDLRQSLAMNGRRIVELHYDWQPIGRNFNNLIETTKCSVQPS